MFPWEAGEAGWGTTGWWYARWMGPGEGKRWCDPEEGVVARVEEPDISQLERKGEEWAPFSPPPQPPRRSGLLPCWELCGEVQPCALDGRKTPAPGWERLARAGVPCAELCPSLAHQALLRRLLAPLSPLQVTSRAIRTETGNCEASQASGRLPALWR